MSSVHVSQYVGFPSAQITNLILLILIVKKAYKMFGQYCYVMTIFTINSIIFTWVEMMSLPLMHGYRSLFILMNGSFLRHSLTWGFHLMCLYGASYSVLISLLATQFFYRYLVICKPEHLCKLNGSKLCLLFVPTIILFFVWYFSLLLGMSNTDDKVEYSRKVVMEFYGENTSKTAFVALQLWSVDSNGKYIFRIFDAISYLICSLIIFICFSTICFCTSQIMMKQKRQQQYMSEKTKEMNKQLLKTMIFQTIFPFFMMYITVGVVLTLPLFEIELGKLANIPGSLAGIYPAVEPLFAIYFVKDFRKTVFRCGNYQNKVSNISQVRSTM
ncbi:Serpentine receptor class r-10 [Caenorhabditis elegans]|uniref:Serpentine receptor class r-10 n=1 Tax=Caenorhabditis elegans TaxID=6239 RepID=O45981_CAEEL|nr:Seven TM Receptor [Caenorhabditis elegans]CCD64073.1 Seven TM Receptor [Caenorhabditis elegans]|eukprot:NP_505077.1 Seven TM Receptor [Caenorhabditis elegans]